MKLNYKILGLTTILFSAAACSDNEYVTNDPNTDPNAPKCYDVNDLYQDYNIFFKPKQGWVGDPMPFYENGKFHVFYLQDARDGAATFHPWYEATTTDFTAYEDNGEMIPCGTDDEQDGALGTGSVFKHNGIYYGFYTGHNGKLDPREKILLATSTDLKKWTKVEDFEIRASDGYDRNEFRDPVIIRDQASGTFRMLISTRADYKGSWRAVIAQYSSTDLRNWTLETPFYDDDKTFMIECPDVFTEGNYQYLIYSDIDDRMVHYKYRKTGTTEWSTPDRNSLDGIAFYAGKTASDGTNRYLFGWTPTRTANNDYSDFSWGGALVVHRLIQNADGTLKVTIADGIDSKLANAQALKVTSDKGAQNQADTYTLTASSEKAFSVFDRQDGAYKISTVIKAASSTMFGFEFGACGTRKEVFTLTFDLENNQLRQDKIEDGETETKTSVYLSVPANKEFNVSIVVENSVCVIYVNGEIAFSNRIYKMNQNPWAIFADNGSVTFTDLKLLK